MASAEIVLSSIAIALAFVSFAATTGLGILQYQQTSHPHLKVKVEWSYPAIPGEGLGPPFISITVTNKRNVPVALVAWGLTWPVGRKQLWHFMRDTDDLGQALSAALVLGDTVSRRFRVADLVDNAANEGLEAPFRVRAWVRIASGQHFRSRKFTIQRVPA